MMDEKNRIRIEAGLQVHTTRVTIGDTGVEIKGIRKIELTAGCEGAWTAILHVYPCKVDIQALAEAKLICMKPSTPDEPTVEVTAHGDNVRRFVGVYSGVVTERPLEGEVCQPQT